MAFLSVLLGVGVDFFFYYFFITGRRNKTKFWPIDKWLGFMYKFLI